MKTVLVTGAEGFIGSHLVEDLLAKNYKVRALVLYNSFNNWGWLEGIKHSNLEIVLGDIRDPFFCEKLCDQVDEIYHLAALIAIPYSYVAPNSYVDTNITGTTNMCQAALKCKVKRFLHISTSEVYGSAVKVPISEDHPLQPQSPYSASKISAESMAMSFYYAFNLPVTVARPFNTYGPRQSARAVIPTIISQIAAGKKEISLGDTKTTRDFNFVKDTTSGMILLNECDKAIGKIVNIGSNSEVSIEETFNLINNLMKTDCKLKQDQARIRPANSEVQRLKCDNTLIKELTGFKSNFSLEEGLAQTISWLKDPSNLKNYKTEIYNI